MFQYLVMVCLKLYVCHIVVVIEPRNKKKPPREDSNWNMHKLTTHFEGLV